MGSRYLIRLDDACPTMHKENWDRIENILDNYEIKPIVAVIPNNKDIKLKYSEFDKKFWSKVGRWQKNKWIIGLHGYDHQYITKESGLLPINNDSEFSSVPLNIQRNKIRDGIKIMEGENIKPVVWIAPSHSFDNNTLTALKEESDIKIISDGIALLPFSEKGFLWIPQQLGRLRPMGKGVWTTCIHPNTMRDEEFNSLDEFCSLNKGNFVDNISDLVIHYNKRKQSIRDIVYKHYYFVRMPFLKSRFYKWLYNNTTIIKKIIWLFKLK